MRCLQLAGVLAGFGVIALGTVLLQAADLRSTSNGRTVHRRVGYESPAQWVEIAPSDSADEVVHGPMIHDEQFAGPGLVEEPALMDGPGFMAGGCDGCGPSCGPACEPSCGRCRGLGWNCCRPCGYWARAELLLWWRRGRYFPPLVTSSPGGTDANQAGVLGQPGTLVLFGDDSEGDNVRTGGRVSLGRWLDTCQGWGIEGRLFAVDDAPVNFNLSSDGNPIIARPFFNVSSGQQDSRLIAFPDLFTGSVSIQSRSEVVGAEFYLRRLLGRLGCWRFDLLGGYYFSRIDEDLRIISNDVSIDQSGAVPVGTTTELVDLFETRNQFHGGQIGFLSEYNTGCWSLRMLGKIALGNVQQEVTIQGQSTVTVPDLDPVVTPGGALALETNSGVFERDLFAVVPELGLNIGYRIHPCIELTLGYSLLYWSRIAQPGDQIDLFVNPTQSTGQLDGAPRPEFTFQDSTYWVHGLNIGVECRF